MTKRVFTVAACLIAVLLIVPLAVSAEELTVTFTEQPQSEVTVAENEGVTLTAAAAVSNGESPELTWHEWIFDSSLDEGGYFTDAICDGAEFNTSDYSQAGEYYFV